MAVPSVFTLRITLPLMLALFLTSCGTSGSDSFRIKSTETNPLRDAAASRGIIVGAGAGLDRIYEPDYNTVLGQEFSQLEPLSEMKFKKIHPRPNTDPVPYDFSLSDPLVDYALAHNMLVRGHTLLWHRSNPDWLLHGGYTPAEVSAIAREHITTVMQHFGDNVYAWDVVNEAFEDNGSMRNSVWYNQPGIGLNHRGYQYVEQAFLWAHAAVPSARLFYNDYDAERMNRKSDAIFAMARDFKRRGVPLHGIGFQMHFDLAHGLPISLISIERNLRRFSDLGLEIHITELDIRLRNNSPSELARQASLYSAIANICLQNPNCKVIQTWGFTDKYSWIKDAYPGMGWALPFDSQYEKKPAYYGLHQAFTD